MMNTFSGQSVLTSWTIHIRSQRGSVGSLLKIRRARLGSPPSSVFSSLPRNEATLFWVSSPLLHCFRQLVIKDKTCTNLLDSGQKCTTTGLTFCFSFSGHTAQHAELPHQGSQRTPSAMEAWGPNH